MASHDMNGTGDSTNIVTIDASDEGLNHELKLVVIFALSRALLDVVLILKLLR